MKTNLSRTVEASVPACLLALLALPFTVLSLSAAAHAHKPDIASIDAYGSTQMQADHLPSVALGLVHNDQIMHLRGFGEASQSGRAVTPHTPFILASVSESFTALAIMQLVEAGKVELDAPVQRYLPWFRAAEPVASARNTMRHLLSHTSGLPASACETDQVTMTLEQFVRSLASEPEARRGGLAQGHRWLFGVPAPFDYYNTAGAPAGYLIAHMNGGCFGFATVLSSAGITTMHAPAVTITEEG
jgi:CubicO group peptidase (beta-lactamase class C family)